MFVECVDLGVLGIGVDLSFVGRCFPGRGCVDVVLVSCLLCVASFFVGVGSVLEEALHWWLSVGGHLMSGGKISCSCWREA